VLFRSQAIPEMDALLAAATLGLACDASLMESAYLANAAAAIEISMLGNHPVSASGLHSWMGKRTELAINSSVADSVRVPTTA